MSIADRLRKMDAHSSVQKEFRVYTVQGAFLSVATVSLILYLVMTEIYFNFQVQLSESVHVNATSSRGIEMEFDISFPAVPCSKLQIDSNDPTGQSQSMHLDRQHHVWKHRFSTDPVTKQRNLIGNPSKLELGSTFRKEDELLDHIEEEVAKLLKDQKNLVDVDDEDDEEGGDTRKEVTIEQEEGCGSCYGAGEEGECCDTCEDVVRAYKRKGWRLEDRSKIKQCAEEEKEQDDEGEKEGENEGCNVHGKIALSSGGGNVHLAPGKQSMTRKGGADAQHHFDFLELLLHAVHEWNVSHTIHKLRFGPEYPAATYQLDGATRLVEDTSGMYQYYFQVVPTMYRFMNGTTIQTNQYSVTEHLRHVSPGSNRGLPGVFFFYEVSPLHVDIEEGYRKGWIAFFTSVCAIIGGVVTVMGMIDSFLFSQGSSKREGLAI